jgi:hypothetical protein
MNQDVLFQISPRSHNFRDLRPAEPFGIRIISVRILEDDGSRAISLRRNCGLAQRVCPDRIQAMPKPLTADDIIPLVASLTPQERARLLRLIAVPQGADAPVYQSVPPSREEFSTDEEPLAWDAEGWEGVG